jgi:hypothetical protein
VPSSSEEQNLPDSDPESIQLEANLSYAPAMHRPLHELPSVLCRPNDENACHRNEWLDLADRVQEIEAFGRVATLRVAVAAARAAAPIWQQPPAVFSSTWQGLRASIGTALESAEGVALGAFPAKVAGKAGESANLAFDSAGPDSPLAEDSVRLGARAAIAAAHSAASEWEADYTKDSHSWTPAARWIDRGAGVRPETGPVPSTTWAHMATQDAANACTAVLEAKAPGRDRSDQGRWWVWLAVQRDLIPWAEGRGDPVRDAYRVHASDRAQTLRDDLSVALLEGHVDVPSALRHWLLSPEECRAFACEYASVVIEAALDLDSSKFADLAEYADLGWSSALRGELESSLAVAERRARGGASWAELRQAALAEGEVSSRLFRLDNLCTVLDKPPLRAWWELKCAVREACAERFLCYEGEPHLWPSVTKSVDRTQAAEELLEIGTDWARTRLAEILSRAKA